MATPTGPTAATRTALTADGGDWVARRQPHPDAPGLTDLVDDVERFRAHDVFRRPRLTSPDARRDPRRFARVEELWADLLHRSPRRPYFRLVQDGSTTDPTHVTRRARIGDRDLADLAQPNLIVDRYRAGATVVLQGLHLTDPALARFANNLALELDQPIQINAYLSPSSARGLDVHFDYHDVFVVQLDGAKRWRVWAPIERSREAVGGKHAVARPTLEELDAPLLDLVLAPGDVLYVPRGHPHVAETADAESAHLTVGLLAITWHRVVRHAIDEAVDAGRLRSSIPLSTLDHGADATDAREPTATPDLRDLDLDLSSAAVRRWVAQEIWSKQAATRVRPRGQVDPAAVDGPLAFAPGPLLALTHDAEHASLFVGDRTITFPTEASSFVGAMLRAAHPLHRRDLAGLDDPSSRVVVERLLDEGILVEWKPDTP